MHPLRRSERTLREHGDVEHEERRQGVVEEVVVEDEGEVEEGVRQEGEVSRNVPRG